MCIAILNAKGTTLKKQLLNNCWKNNGDGAGILYIDDDKTLQTFKTLDSFDEFYSNYIRIKQTYGKRRNMLIHFRISTHGVINETNCHPFLVDENVGFIHNGMISGVPDSVQYSDTYMLNDSLLKNLKVGFEQQDSALDFLGEFIGSGNKLVFLNADDEWAIVNEPAGHWNMGCWFSNDSYKQVNDWYDFGGVRKKKGSRVGFAPSYSYNSYNDLYVHSDKNEATFSDKNGVCSDCGTVLYGINEQDRGSCDYCDRYDKDQLALDLEMDELDAKIYNESFGVYEDTCDCCNSKTGEYSKMWNGIVCEDCLEALDGDSVGA